MRDPVEVLRELGAQFAPNFDDYASGNISVSEIQCVLCDTVPCSCVTCGCGWRKAPNKPCQVCD